MNKKIILSVLLGAAGVLGYMVYNNYYCTKSCGEQVDQNIAQAKDKVAEVKAEASEVKDEAEKKTAEAKADVKKKAACARKNSKAKK